MKHQLTTKTVVLGLLLFLSFQLFATPDEDLLKACKLGDFEGVKSAIAAGANVNKLDNGNPPLASAFFWPEITKYLIQQGADPNLGDYPALISACNNYCYETAKILVESGANPNKIGITDPANTFRILIEKEKAKGKDANQASIKVWESLIPTMKKTEVELVRVIVQQTNCAPCLKLVLDKGARIDFNDKSNALETFANFSMTKEERINTFKKGAAGLASYGFKVPEWYTNLPEDLNSEPSKMLELILSKGVDINKPFSNGMTALTTALRASGKLEISKALINNGADPKIIGIQTIGSIKINHYPICHAAQQGDIELIGKMLEGGADINSNATTNSLAGSDGSWGGSGYTPLIISILGKNYEVAEFLINKGAELKIGTNGYAIWESSFENLKCLVSVKNKTPIYWAVEKDNLELVSLIAEKMLWKYNPDFSYDVITNASASVNVGLYNINCKKGKSKISPSKYASEVGNNKASSFLLNKGM